MLMRHMTSILLALSLVGGCRQGEPRLEGTWRSNREATIERWKSEAILSERFISGAEGLLGKVTVTYRGGIAEITDGSWREKGKYKVLASDSNSVVIQSFSNVFEKDVRCTISFVKDGFWVSHDDILAGYVEKFDRIE